MNQYEPFQTMLHRSKTEGYVQEMSPSILEKACSIIILLPGQPYVPKEGNKRTALTVFKAFLTLHNYKLTLILQQAENLTVYVAYDDKFEENDGIPYTAEEIGVYIQPLERSLSELSFSPEEAKSSRLILLRF